MFKILGVDDSLTIRKLLEMVLAKSGYRVILATNAREAVQLANSEKPDLILLDYILPDGKGTDVCQELLRDPANRRIPILLMSAKGAEIRQFYQDIPTVVDYLTKPFTPEVLKAVVAHTLQKVQGTKAPAREGASPSGSTLAEASAKVAEAGHSFVSKETREAAARAIYQHLKGRLNLLPEWLEQYQEEARRGQAETASVYFARRLLRREVIDGLFDELRTILGEEEILQLSLIQGRSTFYPLPEVLEMILQRKASGVLAIQAATWSVEGHFVEGQLSVATCDEARIYAEGSEFPFESVPIDLLQKAVKRQRSSKRPMFLTLQEGGFLTDPAELKRLLREATIRCMVAAMKERDTTFRFHTARRLPDHAVSDERIPVRSLLFESLRHVDDWSAIEQEIRDFEVVFARAPGCRQVLSQMGLRDDERSILEKVDGRRTVKRIIAESGMIDYTTCRILYRLLKVGAIREVPAWGGAPEATASREASAAEAGKVVIVTPGKAEEYGSLVEALRPIASVEILNSGFDRTPYLIGLLRPEAVLVEIGREEFDARRIVQGIRANPALEELPLYSIGKPGSPEIEAELKVFGFSGFFDRPLDPDDVGAVLRRELHPAVPAIP